MIAVYGKYDSFQLRVMLFGCIEATFHDLESVATKVLKILSFCWYSQISSHTFKVNI